MKNTVLRNFLVADGYIRIGNELFMRVAGSRKIAQKHFRRLEDYGPSTGIVRVLELTEKQYKSIRYLAGGPDRQEIIVGRNNHIVL